MTPDPYQEEGLLEGRGPDRRLLRWMLAYARPELPALAGCVLLLAGLAGLELAQPYLIKTAIDQVLAPGAGTGDALLLARLCRWPVCTWPRSSAWPCCSTSRRSGWGRPPSALSPPFARTSSTTCSA